MKILLERAKLRDPDENEDDSGILINDTLAIVFPAAGDNHYGIFEMDVVVEEANRTIVSYGKEVGVTATLGGALTFALRFIGFVGG